MSKNPERVLVVDDDQTTLTMIANLLTAAGFVVTTAANPRDAIFALHEAPYDVLLLDWHFPGSRGSAIANEIRASKQHGHVAIIAMSGFTDTVTRQAVMAAGCDDFLPKPFSIADLATAIRNGAKLTRMREKHGSGDSAAL